MANLNETDQWEAGIYQLEEDDPVLGGPTGIDNVAPRQLANRGRYQRLRNVTPWDATFTYPANVAYVGYGGTTWKSVGESLGVVPGADAAKWVRWGFTAAELGTALGDAVAIHEAKDDPHPAYWNDPRGNAKIAAAIAALVNSSPAALDTLAELATALGGDSNFAATVTNALASKAPLLSPVLTGTPTAPTQAAFDNSTKLATTASVKRQGMQASEFNAITGTTTLNATHAGGIVYLGGAGNYVVTMPLAESMPPGARIEFISGVGEAPVTIVPQGANRLAMNATNFALSAKMALGDTLVLETNGANWFASGGSAPLAYTGGFASLLANSGYQKLPSGLILQWTPGAFAANLPTAVGSTTGQSVPFPIPFPTACVFCGVSLRGGNLESVEITGAAESYTRSGAVTRFLRVNGSNTSGAETFDATVFAIGF